VLKSLAIIAIIILAVIIVALVYNLHAQTSAVSENTTNPTFKSLPTSPSDTIVAIVIVSAIFVGLVVFLCWP
jgi:L-asparagine transporter-like permease